jgi:hypothetical protein
MTDYKHPITPSRELVRLFMDDLLSFLREIAIFSLGVTVLASSLMLLAFAIKQLS